MKYKGKYQQMSSNRLMFLYNILVRKLLSLRLDECSGSLYSHECSVAWLFLLGCQYQCKWLTGKTRFRNFRNDL